MAGRYGLPENASRNRAARAAASPRRPAIIGRLEALRALCEVWDGADAPPASVQEAARELLMQLDRRPSADEYEAFEDDVSPFYLEPPPGS